MRQTGMVGTPTCSARRSFTELCPGEAPGGLGAFDLRSPSCSELSIAPQIKFNPLLRPYLIWPAYLPNSICSPHPHLCPSHPGLPVLTNMKLRLRALSQLFLLLSSPLL